MRAAKTGEGSVPQTAAPSTIATSAGAGSCWRAKDEILHARPVDHTRIAHTLLHTIRLIHVATVVGLLILSAAHCGSIVAHPATIVDSEAMIQLACRPLRAPQPMKPARNDKADMLCRWQQQAQRLAGECYKPAAS